MITCFSFKLFAYESSFDAKLSLVYCWVWLIIMASASNARQKVQKRGSCVITEPTENTFSAVVSCWLMFTNSCCLCLPLFLNKSQLMRPGIGRNASCTVDGITSRPIFKGNVVRWLFMHIHHGSHCQNDIHSFLLSAMTSYKPRTVEVYIPQGHGRIKQGWCVSYTVFCS